MPEAWLDAAAHPSAEEETPAPQDARKDFQQPARMVEVRASPDDHSVKYGVAGRSRHEEAKSP
jgi:hypothetical protein